MTSAEWWSRKASNIGLKYRSQLISIRNNALRESEIMIETVKAWYDTHAEYEWSRLFQDGYHQLEYLVTMHFLEEYLPKQGLVLDAGGGTGRYAIELAKKGYRVVLLDLSPKCLEIARNQTREAGVEGRVKEILEGSITDLSRFKNEFFDAVLCLGGPLSHLLEKSERERAASELVRVAKKKSPLFVSVFNRYGFYRVLLRSGENLSDASHEEMFATGVHRDRYQHPKAFRRTRGFTDAYFFFPSEIRKMFEDNEVQTLAIATCQGLSSDLEEDTNMLQKNKENWTKWLELLLRTCTDPCILGFGNHLLYVGRKM
jgi:SAM-dependent methyltransferase